VRLVIQRVNRAAVRVGGAVVGAIGRGLVVLAGVETGDGAAQAEQAAEKLAGLRVFEDEQGKMNRDLVEVGGAMLVVSQFTLYGDARKGKRPSFIEAARPEKAIPLYETFVLAVRELGIEVQTGRFGAMMQVELVNDGPVTILLDSPAAGIPRGPSESSHGRDPCRG
jgi:D-tyrosyl-tRNA(Tyr) deacylase